MSKFVIRAVSTGLKFDLILIFNSNIPKSIVYQ